MHTRIENNLVSEGVSKVPEINDILEPKKWSMISIEFSTERTERAHWSPLKASKSGPPSKILLYFFIVASWRWPTLFAP